MKKRLLAVILANSFVFADDFKLGFVDVSKIFTKSVPSIALQNALKNKFVPLQQELRKMHDDLLAEQTQMQELMKKAPSMDKLNSKDKKKLEEVENRYRQDQMNFQQKYSSYTQSVQKTQDFASNLLLSKVNLILKQISDNGKYDLVLTSNQLVYAKPKYDLTDQVIEQLKKVNGEDLVKQLNEAEKKQLNNNDQKSVLNEGASSINAETKSNEVSATVAEANPSNNIK